MVVYQALSQLFHHFGMKKNVVVHISHIGLINELLKDQSESERKTIIKHLDTYHKQTHEQWTTHLRTLTGDVQLCDRLIALIENKACSSAPDCPAKTHLEMIISHLQHLNIPVQFDLSIVRGHGYYS